MERLVGEMERRSPPPLRTSFDTVQPVFLPPGIKFEGLSLFYKHRGLKLDSLELKPALGQWLAFKKAWRLKILHEGSLVRLEFRTEQKIPPPDGSTRALPFWFVKGLSPVFQLGLLGQIFPSVEVAGLINSRWNFEGSPADIQTAEGILRLKGRDIKLSQTQIPTPFGPLNLPSVQWKRGELEIKLKEGELVFRNLILGAPSDDFLLQMKGSAALVSSYGRLRLDSYDAQLQMDIVKDFKISLLDLMFAGFKQDKGAFYRYGVRLTGRGDQVPDMEKFPGF